MATSRRSYESYGVFSGNTSLVQSGEMKRSGYCAIVSEKPVGGGIDLEGYKALALTVRTDGRVYTVNLAMDSMLSDDLYQGYINLDAGEWHTIELPFDRFMVTARGQPRAVQRTMDVHRMLTIGVTLADRKEGSFRFEIESIKALPALSDNINVYSAPSKSAKNVLLAAEDALPDKQ